MGSLEGGDVGAGAASVRRIGQDIAKQQTPPAGAVSAAAGWRLSVGPASLADAGGSHRIMRVVSGVARAGDRQLAFLSFLGNTAFRLSNSSILTPFFFMISDCWRIDRRLFHDQ